MEQINYTIHAVDFDGTLCENRFPEIGEPNMILINELIYKRECGDKVILWTNREGELLGNAVKFCSNLGLEFDAVNDNIPEMIEYLGHNTRKVFANVFIDDLAENKEKYLLPYHPVPRKEISAK